MNLYDQANKDVQAITGNSAEWGKTILLTAPSGETAIIIGIHMKHNLGVDTNGNLISAKTAHLSFSEENLIAANPYYPLRNLKNEVDLENHKISVKDSTGIF